MEKEVKKSFYSDILKSVIPVILISVIFFFWNSFIDSKTKPIQINNELTLLKQEMIELRKEIESLSGKNGVIGGSIVDINTRLSRIEGKIEIILDRE